MSESIDKCIVQKCENYTYQGKPVGDLCYPCYEFLSDGSKNDSQARVNQDEAIDKATKKLEEDKASNDTDYLTKSAQFTALQASYEKLIKGIAASDDPQREMDLCIECLKELRDLYAVD